MFCDLMPWEDMIKSLHGANVYNYASALLMVSCSVIHLCSKIEEEIKTESSKAEILAKDGSSFNENCCVRCFSRFFFIFNQKVKCISCQYFVCKNCSEYDKEKKDYICHVCQKQGWAIPSTSVTNTIICPKCKQSSFVLVFCKQNWWILKPRQRLDWKNLFNGNG